MVSTVKAYTEHEEQVFEDITNAREALAQSFNTGDLEQISEANDSLTTAVNRLISVVEDNPELTASEQYTSLMDQIEGSVNRISIARKTITRKCRNTIGQYAISLEVFLQKSMALKK